MKTSVTSVIALALILAMCGMACTTTGGGTKKDQPEDEQSRWFDRREPCPRWDRMSI